MCSCSTPAGPGLFLFLFSGSGGGSVDVSHWQMRDTKISKRGSLLARRSYETIERQQRKKKKKKTIKTIKKTRASSDNESMFSKRSCYPKYANNNKGPSQREYLLTVPKYLPTHYYKPHDF